MNMNPFARFTVISAGANRQTFYRPLGRAGRFAVLLILAGAVLTGCGPKRESHRSSAPESPTAQVKVQAVELKKWAATEEVVGTVRARTRATLEAKVSGRIDRLPVNLGQRLKAGDLVAHLDAPEIAARLQQAEAAFQQAERDWKRVSALFDQQAVTRAEVDSAEGRYLMAKAGVAEAQAMTGYIEVRAPFDGLVTRKHAEMGDLAVPGKPLVDLEDPAGLQFEAEVPDALAGRIQPQARMNIHLDRTSRMPAGAGAEKGPGRGERELDAVVSEIAPASDPVSRTFRVKLDLPEGTGLMPGQFARLSVPLGDSTVLLVPASVVVQRGQLELAFVVDKDRARLHLVKTGRTVGGEVEILSGLEAGDNVVTQNPSQLIDGQPVQAQ